MAIALALLDFARRLPAAAPLPPMAKSRPLRRESEPLPAEIAFLADCPEVPLEVLLEAAAIARRAGVTADIVLLQEGMLEEETLYRCLALHIGASFLEAPIPVRLTGRLQSMIALGWAPLAHPIAGAVSIIAPRGATLSTILAFCRDRPGAGSRLIVTTPRRFASLVRHAARGAMARAASYDLFHLDRSLSAVSRTGWGQIAAAMVASLHLGILIGVNPVLALTAVSMACGIVFAAAIHTRISATAASPPPMRDGALRRTPDRELPLYTIIVPLHGEARIVRKTIAALDALDYPRSKLEVKIVVELHDHTTIAALEALRLPPRYEIIVAPEGRPRTKPRALNIALAFALGSLTVVYDAEDRPDPGQLRAAADRFARLPASVACLQAKLAVDNTEDSWLTRLFTVEYAALFDVLNPGLAALRLPLPLGGSSNHFRTQALREVGGWDAWNVTEDADLGIRLARSGYDVETLDSSTLEEAPRTTDRWLGQRSRWLKGWMQTLLVHSRQPWRLIRELGIRRSAAVLTLLLNTVLTALFGPAFAAIAIVALVSGSLWRATLSGVVVASLALTLFVVSIVCSLWTALLALKRRGWLNLCKSLWLFPVYSVLLSIASWRGFIELLHDPHSWTKTEHGLARSSRLDRQADCRRTVEARSLAEENQGSPVEVTQAPITARGVRNGRRIYPSPEIIDRPLRGLLSSHS